MAYTQYPSRDRQMTNTFYGLDKGKRIRDGAWNDMLNMTCDGYPVAATRKKRINMTLTGSMVTGERITDAAVMSDLTYPEGAVVTARYNSLPASGENNVTIQYGEYIFRFDDPEEQRIIPFGRDIFIYPKMKTISFPRSAYEMIREDDVHISCTGFTYSMTDEAGASITIQTTKPDDPQNGDYWYDSVTNGLYKYSEGFDEWIAFAAAYIKIAPAEASTSAFHSFVGSLKTGNAIRIKGSGSQNIDQSFIVHKIHHFEESAGGDYILVRGYAPSGTDTSAATIERRAPVFDFAVQHRNRIWGCRYGNNDDGEFVNEIYGSALGDPLDYFNYEGTAADSFTASVGTGTKWTGIGVVDDYVVFFKEDRYYVLSGTEPPFRLREVQAEGVQYGSDKSVCEINGYLYYKSNHGVVRMRADSMPVCISEELGDDVYAYAKAGTDGRKYYVDMAHMENFNLFPEGRYFFVYDTATGLWTEEELPAAYTDCFVRYRNNVLCLGHTEGNYSNLINASFLNGIYDMRTILLCNETAMPEKETNFTWHAETGLLGLGDPDEKIARTIQIRAKTALGARLRCAISYDDSDEWTQIYNEIREATTTHVISHKPGVRCDTFRLRFSGVGACDIYSITITTEGAGDNVHY